MRKESTTNQGLDENLICRSLEFFALQKIGMTLLFCLLTSTTVHAECVPYPSCASIGYTETSCETQAVKCPFDASKLFCLPCDTKYQYSCNEIGQTGSGTSCQGKYENCNCVSGYVSFCDVTFCS